jgi:hypothetical protein
MAELLESLPLERFDWNGRWYSPIPQDGEERIYFPSVTTITHGAIPKGYGWNKWLGDSPSFEHAMNYADKAAQLGDCFHALVNWMTRGEKISTKETWFDDRREEELGLPPELIIRLLGFIRWWHEYDPKPIASEIMLCGNDDFRWAGTADLVCEIKDEIWLIDYKTGKEWEKDHGLQLIAYEMLWNNLYPEMKIQKRSPLYVGERGGVTFYKKKYQYRPDAWLLCYDWWLEVADNTEPNPPEEFPEFLSLTEAEDGD